MEKPKKPKRIGALNDVKGVQRELRTLYREARRGEVDTIDLSRLVAALREMRGGLVAETFEHRIAALEEAAAKRERTARPLDLGGKAHGGQG